MAPAPQASLWLAALALSALAAGALAAHRRGGDEQEAISKCRWRGVRRARARAQGGSAGEALCHEKRAEFGAAASSAAWEEGPCLSDRESRWAVDNWVCDVAHLPRQVRGKGARECESARTRDATSELTRAAQPVDNKRKNQCDDFHAGKARHFVEVDTRCNPIVVDGRPL
jgi:hypothetical protein